MILVMQSFTKASISVYTEIQAGVFKFLRFRDGFSLNESSNRSSKILFSNSSGLLWMPGVLVNLNLWNAKLVRLLN